MIGSNMFSTALAAALAGIALASPVSIADLKCPVIKDGRVPMNMTVQDFDTITSPFSPKYVKGQNLTWSQIIKLPHVKPSKFDFPADKAVEVTLSDQSIFLPGGSKPQLGFRRAGLLLGNGSDATNVGVKTFHWSVQQDPKRKMNLTHEYMNVWHERNDYKGNQFSFNTGIMLSQDQPTDSNVSTIGLDKNLWKILNNKNDVIWSTQIACDGWQNFALMVDYVKSTLQVYYSAGQDPLQAVTQPLANDNSGGGQFQLGMAKKPTETTTVVFDGYQESNLHEGQIYGGIFVEDSSGGCIST